MARIPYFDPTAASEDVRAELAKLPHLQNVNIFRMAAHADSAFVPYLGFAGTLLTRLKLDPSVRELVILLVAHRAESQYEWGQHVAIARAIGATDEQIEAVECDRLDAPCLDAAARAALRFAAAVLNEPRVADDTFAALQEQFDEREIVELLLVIGNYLMLARIMTTLDVDAEEAVGAAVVSEAEQRHD